MIRVFTMLVMVAMLVLSSGCGSTPKQVAYKTLKAVGMTVDKAADALAVAYVQGKVTEAELMRAKVALAEYNVSYVAACEAAAGSVDAIAPDDTQRLANEFLILVNTFSK